MQFAARFEFALDPATRDLCRQIPLDDLPAERIWGEIEKLLLQARTAVDRASRSHSISASSSGCFPKFDALVGCEQEPEWHPEGDVWVHTLMVIDQARTRIDDLDHPRQVVVMLGARLSRSRQAADDGVHRRPDSIDRSRAGGRRAGDRRAGSPQHPHDRRVRRPSAGARHRRASPEAGHVPAVADAGVATARFGGSRRRWTSSCSRASRSPTASAARGSFDCSAMDWFLERAQALGVEHAPPEPIVKGRHLLALGLTPGPRVGAVLRQIYERQLDGSIATLEDGHHPRARDSRRAILIRLSADAIARIQPPCCCVARCAFDDRRVRDGAAAGASPRIRSRRICRSAATSADARVAIS